MSIISWALEYRHSYEAQGLWANVNLFQHGLIHSGRMRVDQHFDPVIARASAKTERGGFFLQQVTKASQRDCKIAHNELKLKLRPLKKLMSILYRWLRDSRPQSVIELSAGFAVTPFVDNGDYRF